MINKKVKNASIAEYNGIKFRSKLEKEVAKTLDDLNIKYEYENKKFILIPSFRYENELIRQISYTPDFIIGNLIIECKGFPTDSWKIKRKLFLNYLVNKENNYIFVEIKSVKNLLDLIDMDDRFITKNVLATSLKTGIAVEYNSVSEALEALDLVGKSKGNIEQCFKGLRKSAHGYTWKRVERVVIPLEGEVWKDVVGFEGLYKVSNLGRVASTQFHGENNFKLMSLVYNRGYTTVKLRNWKKNISGNYLVHRLVAEAFIPNIESKPHIDHINTIRDDNRVENLRWVTHLENQRNPITNKRLKEFMTELNHQKIGNTVSTNNRKRKVQHLLETGQVEIFDSITDAANNINKHPPTIQRWCNKGKYGWSYLNTEQHEQPKK